MNQELSKYTNKAKQQLVPLSFSSIIASIIHGIVAYLAAYFFKPLWEKIVRWWNNAV